MLPFNAPELNFSQSVLGRFECLLASSITVNWRMINHFCFTCPGIGRWGDAWRRWFRLRTKGQFLREALTTCIICCPTVLLFGFLWWSSPRAMYYKMYCHFQQLFIYIFLSRNLQKNIWKPFLGKFYPPTKKIVIDKNLHKERFALMESHLSFVQFHF